MDKTLKKYTDEEKKFAEEVFGQLHKSFEKSFEEDEEIKNRWAKYIDV